MQPGELPVASYGLTEAGKVAVLTVPGSPAASAKRHSLATSADDGGSRQSSTTANSPGVTTGCTEATRHEGGRRGCGGEVVVEVATKEVNARAE